MKIFCETIWYTTDNAKKLELSFRSQTALVNSVQWRLLFPEIFTLTYTLRNLQALMFRFLNLLASLHTL